MTNLNGWVWVYVALLGIAGFAMAAIRLRDRAARIPGEAPRSVGEPRAPLGYPLPSVRDVWPVREARIGAVTESLPIDPSTWEGWPTEEAR